MHNHGSVKMAYGVGMTEQRKREREKDEEVRREGIQSKVIIRQVRGWSFQVY